MDAPRSPSILLAAPHPWLRETLLQVLHDWPGAIHTAEGRASLFAQARGDAAVAILTPFAFGEHGADLLRELHQVAPHLRLVALIPDDDGDYRLAALRGGADAVVSEPQADVELVPTLQAMLRAPEHRPLQRRTQPKSRAEEERPMHDQPSILVSLEEV